MAAKINPQNNDRILMVKIFSTIPVSSKCLISPAAKAVIQKLSSLEQWVAKFVTSEKGTRLPIKRFLKFFCKINLV